MITYAQNGIKARVVGGDGHFCAIIARLVKHSLGEHHEYIRILFKPRIKLPVVVFRLWCGTISPSVTLRQCCHNKQI